MDPTRARRAGHSRGTSRDGCDAGGRPVQVMLNGDNANTATTVLGYAAPIVRSASARTGSSGVARLRRRSSAWSRASGTTPSSGAALFLVPGLIAYIAMITAVVSTALSIVREKERGTMEQVRMAPIGALRSSLGKTIPYLRDSHASSMAIVLASMVLFDLPMRGRGRSWSSRSWLFLVGALGLGPARSRPSPTRSRWRSRWRCWSSFLPTLMLSGFIFPIASMPAALQPSPRRAGALLPGRAARHRAEGRSVSTSFWSNCSRSCVFARRGAGAGSVRLRRQWA